MDWIETKLSAITLKIASGSTPRGGKESYKRSGITLIRSLNIYDFDFKYKDLAFIDEEQAKKLSNVIIEENDILLNITGASVGRCSMVPNHLLPARINQHVMIIRIDQRHADAKFILYMINSPQYKMSLMSLAETGATREALTKDDISNFKINLPPLKTQQKIASILSNYDKLIENNTQRIKLLESMAEELYKEWFVRLRFPGYEAVEVVDGLPVGWERKSLKDIAILTMGQSPKSDAYNHEGEGLPFHQGVTNYGFRFPTNENWSREGKRYAKKGDILFSVRAPVGRLNIASEKIIIGRGVSSIRHKKNWNNFLFYALKNLFFEDDLIGSGAIFSSVTKKDMEDIKLVIADNEVMISFNELVEPIDKEIEVLLFKNITLKQTRDLLLPRLMSGKLNVKDLDII